MSSRHAYRVGTSSSDCGRLLTVGLRRLRLLLRGCVSAIGGRSMPRVEGSLVIDAPAAGLFALSQDYALRRQWDPFVREMRFLGGVSEAAQGVRVWVRAWTGLTMEVELTA